MSIRRKVAWIDEIDLYFSLRYCTTDDARGQRAIEHFGEERYDMELHGLIATSMSVIMSVDRMIAAMGVPHDLDGVSQNR